jgi:hypothetical protein
MRQTIHLAFVLLGMLALLPLTGAWAADKSDKMPVPPADAHWTLSCQTFEGPVHVEEAKRARDAMVKLTGDRNWYVMHGEHDSTLFFGFYRSIDLQAPDSADKKDAERAHADRKRLAALRNDRDVAAFTGCLLVPLDAPGQDGPPEWNVQNAPKDALWTLLIGVYRDAPTRKKAAVDAVRLLRSQGHDAFYFHAEFQSFVYVGQWPAAAVLREEADTSHASHDENERVMVVDRDLDPRTPRTYTDTDGAIVHLVGPTLTIRDASVTDLMGKFPNFHTNGEVLGKRIRDPKTGTERVEYELSVLSKIPRREASILNAGVPEPPPTLKAISPGGRQPPKGAGKLKSLDDK